MKTEKILVGVRNVIPEKDRAARAILNIKEALMGRTLVMGKVHGFIKLHDMEQIVKGEKMDIVDRYKAHLQGQTDTIRAQVQAVRHEESIPFRLEELQENIKQIRSVFQLPEFMPLSAFSFYEKDNGTIDVKIDEALINAEIQKYCNVYAETEKELRLFELAGAIAANLSEFKALADLHGTTNDSIVIDTNEGSQINAYGLYNIFTLIKNNSVAV